MGSHNPPPCNHFLLQSKWDLPIYSLRGRASLLTHCLCPPTLGLNLVAGTSPDVLLYTKRPKLTATRYYPLWGFLFRASLKIFKKPQLAGGFHTLVKGVSFFSLTDVLLPSICGISRLSLQNIESSIVNFKILGKPRWK